MLDVIQSILSMVNVESRDNGSVFTTDTRRQNIRSLLVHSPFVELPNSPDLSTLYRHAQFESGQRIVLLSCHIDSRYRRHFHDVQASSNWLGTFDNSICNAILVALMQADHLPSNVWVAFTGDEEVESRGATQTIEWFEQHNELWKCLECVIVLDVTSVGYGSRSFTLENGFVECEPLEGEPVFDTPDALFDSLNSFLEQKGFSSSQYTFVDSEHAGEDESWEYDEWDLNCFSLCLPTAPHPKHARRSIDFWMHHEDGIRIEPHTLKEYGAALSSLCVYAGSRFSSVCMLS